MKLVKFSALLLAGLAIASTTYAQPFLTTAGSSVKADTIHTLDVVNSGSRHIIGQFTLYPGNVQGNTCVSARSVPAGSFQFDGHSKVSMFLSGTGLRNTIGLGYGCIDMVLETDKQTTHDTFRVFNDGVTYTATSPNYDSVTIH